MIKKFMIVLLTIMTVLGIAIFIPGGEAKAAYSDFDSGLDGWTFSQPLDFTWVDLGSNLGGYVLFEDHHYDPPATQSGYAYAPAKFLGDWSNLDGVGFISFDYRIFDLGSMEDIDPILRYEINISGPDGYATWWGGIHPEEVDTDWITVTAWLNVGLWEFDYEGGGSWSELLDQVDELEIRIEYVRNDSADHTLRDEAGFDNVRVEAIPIPSAVWLLGSGLIGLVGFRRNFRKV